MFRPNQNLKYKVLLHSRPKNIDMKILDYFIRGASGESILQVTYNVDKSDLLNVEYNLYIKNDSCLNPFSLISKIYPTRVSVKNVIKSTGEFVYNIQDELKMSCIFGFDLLKIRPEDKSKEVQPIVFPIYFSDNEISINDKWVNVFYNNDNKAFLEIEYHLKNILHNIAIIEGTTSKNIFIEVNFNIESGYINSLRMYNSEHGKNELFKSFELID